MPLYAFLKTQQRDIKFLLYFIFLQIYCRIFYSFTYIYIYLVIYIYMSCLPDERDIVKLIVVAQISSCSFFLFENNYYYIYIYIIHIYMYIYKYICTYIYKQTYIFTNLSVNAIVRLFHPWRGDSTGQETFLTPSVEKETWDYATDCSNHQPSLSTLRSKELSCRKMSHIHKFTGKSSTIYIHIYTYIYIYIYIQYYFYFLIIR